MVKPDRVIARMRYELPRKMHEGIKKLIGEARNEMAHRIILGTHSGYRHSALGEPHFKKSFEYKTWKDGTIIKGAIYSTHPRAEWIIPMFYTGTRSGYYQGMTKTPVFIDTPTERIGDTTKGGYIAVGPPKDTAYGDIGIYVRRVKAARVTPVLANVRDEYEKKIRDYIIDKAMEMDK